MPLLRYVSIILRRNSLLSITNIATHENTIVATPQSGCITSLLQLQVDVVSSENQVVAILGANQLLQLKMHSWLLQLQEFLLLLRLQINLTSTALNTAIGSWEAIFMKKGDKRQEGD